jgi:hypothetical protein
LRDDGLIEFIPGGAINTSAKVRLTDKGEEHLIKLKDQGIRKLLWIAGTAIIAGLVTFALS